MNAYTFNSEGFFAGIVACQKDPLESERQRRDIYLLPADATFQAPPEFLNEDETAKWTGSLWVREPSDVEVELENTDGDKESFDPILNL